MCFVASLVVQSECLSKFDSQMHKIWKSFSIDNVFYVVPVKVPKSKVRTFQRLGSRESLVAPFGKHLIHSVKLSIILMSAEQQMELTSKENLIRYEKKPCFFSSHFNHLCHTMFHWHPFENPAFFLEYFIYKCH